MVKRCAECGRDFQPSSRHRRCPGCRAKNACVCGNPKQAKSKQCASCRSVADVMIRVPGHPRARRSAYVFEHIIVATATAYVTTTGPKTSNSGLDLSRQVSGSAMPSLGLARYSSGTTVG